jgi:hypothetical protein
VPEIRKISPKSGKNIGTIKHRETSKHRTTSSGGAKRRAPPQAGLLLVPCFL